MNKIIHNRIVIIYNLLAGIVDTLTGLGLIIFPFLTLSMMGMEPGQYPHSMIRFIGAFVFGVGSLYLWGLYVFNKNRKWLMLQLNWLVTAWMRACVAVVTSWMLVTGELSPAWMSVPLTDAALALFQFAWIKSGRFPQDEQG